MKGQFELIHILNLHPDECLSCWGSSVLSAIYLHIDVEAGFQSLKSTIAETGMGVTSRP